MYFWFNLEDKYYIGKKGEKSNLYIDGDLYHVLPIDHEIGTTKRVKKVVTVK